MVFENKEEFKALVIEAVADRFNAIDKKFNAIDGRFNAMVEKFTDQFRYQAILMEETNRTVKILYDTAINAGSMTTDLNTLTEAQENLAARTTIIEKKLKKI
mgnify:CR=1 FL=1